MDMSGFNVDESPCYYFGDPQAKDDYLAAINQVAYEEQQQKELILANQVAVEANTWVMINQLPSQLYNQASTTNGVNNSPSPQLGISCALEKPITGRKRLAGTTGDRGEQKRLNDKAYRERLKEGKKMMDSTLEELKMENQKLKGENEILIKDKNFAEQKSQRENHEVNQSQSTVHRLSRKSDHLRIRVDGFVKKICDNGDEQIKQLKDELSLIDNNGWEDWMLEKLKLLNRIKLLKHQNRSLNVQVQALCNFNILNKDNQPL